MKRQVGFTLMEVIVVVGLLGILALTASPVYHTYRQRAYGGQATVMAKQLVEGQILHYLEKDQFFPTDSSKTIFIPPDIPPSAATQQALQDILDNLNISIPLSQHLYYQINTGDANADQWCQIRIWAPFPLFKTGRNDLNYSISKDGKITLF
jgi:prepilin-type N-terminal cleavage/methylation domain-containing protein